MIYLGVLWHLKELLVIIIILFILLKAVSYFISKKIFYRLSQPLSKSAIRAIAFLVSFSLFFLILNSLLLVPENIILKTSSKIQTPGITLAARLSHLRQITEYDQKLLQRLKHLNGRLLYVLYGPSTLGLCEWCEIETPITFLYYTIPHVLLYYLINLGAIQLSVSTLFGKTINPWGKLVFIITLVFFISELITLKMYDWESNAYTASALDINWIHWKLNKYRLYFTIILNLFVAFIIWINDTNVWCQMPSKEEQLHFSIKNLEESINRIRTLSIINRVAIEDEFLQKQKLEFCQRKKQLKELDDRNARNRRKNMIPHNNMKNFVTEIENYVESLIEHLDMIH
ncbi:hypothetical protein PORY_001306 [Pneumocystis oryctolagi]|uniref:Uncharacterized protein n=1 Tax=Pneumocystis oryctolagi TaxID=42067 RepID=A0ACB7CBY5_9ASCO|nr:hypothetical protein PORY_001306 [Pneumocystis oryctolagi]